MNLRRLALFLSLLYIIVFGIQLVEGAYALFGDVPLWVMPFSLMYFFFAAKFLEWAEDFYKFYYTGEKP